MGKEEDGRVKPVQVEQKQNAKGIGYGTEGAFAPWWDDLYTKTAVGTQIKSKDDRKKGKKEGDKSSDKRSKKSKKEKVEKKGNTENRKLDKVKKKSKDGKDKRSKEKIR